MKNVRNAALLALLVIAGLLSGCASSEVRDPAPESGVLQQIAVDFTDVLTQLENLQPSDTTLLWSEVTQFAGPFSAVLKSGLSAAGYDIVSSDDRDDEYAVGYFRIEDAFAEDAVSGTYIVSVGDIQLRRSYHHLSDGTLVATSDMVGRGTDMARVQLDTLALPTVRISEMTADPAAEAVSPVVDRGSLYAGVQNLAGEPAGSEPFLNLSNVHEEILSFDSESLLLTGQSRALLQIVVARFDPESDVVVLVGCSQGESQREHGNAELAVARAQAASRELQRNGVPERNIFEAGCWANEVKDSAFPLRGVVVTLKREVI